MTGLLGMTEHGCLHCVPAAVMPVGDDGEREDGCSAMPAANWGGLSVDLGYVWQSLAALGACWEVCLRAPNPLALGRVGHLHVLPPPPPAKGQTYVLFTPKLTYTAYRNLLKFD